MTQQIVSISPSLTRRQLLLANQSPKRSIRLAEVAGGTTAECAAICCCCPYGLIHLLVLAVYKLPAGLCRKALKKRRQRLKKKKGILPPGHRCTCGCNETETSVNVWSTDELDKSESDDSSFEEVLDLENEIWERFYSTGFWRSSSQKEDP